VSRSLEILKIRFVGCNKPNGKEAHFVVVDNRSVRINGKRYCRACTLYIPERESFTRSISRNEPNSNSLARIGYEAWNKLCQILDIENLQDPTTFSCDLKNLSARSFYAYWQWWLGKVYSLLGNSLPKDVRMTSCLCEEKLAQISLRSKKRRSQDEPA